MFFEIDIYFIMYHIVHRHFEINVIKLYNMMNACCFYTAPIYAFILCSVLKLIIDMRIEIKERK